MFLAIQFPFTDARGFLADGGGRLSRPAWPLVSAGKDFVRSSGLVRPRRRGGVSDWAGEEIYGDAKRALRFQNRLGAKAFAFGLSTYSLDCAFRRFHSQGVVARLEIGFRLGVERAGRDGQLLSLLRQILEIQVTVPDIDSQQPVLPNLKLGEAGNRLAKHFLVSTTDHKRKPLSNALEPWWFTCGNLSIAVEYLGDAALPTHTRHVMDVPGTQASLFHTWLDFGKQRCSVWFIRNGLGDRDAVRRLRIHLTRLHSERECLRNILLHIQSGDRFELAKGGASSDQIQLYLKDAVNLLQRPRFMGLQQSAMLEAAREALGTAFEGETASLESIRRQIAAQVDGFVRRAQNTATVINYIEGNYMSTNIQMGNVTVSGDFNVVTATNIQNSFNKAANSGVPEELKAKLKELSVQVANLVKQLPPDDAEKVSKDLEALTSESVSKKPRREWYELSAKGLVEATKTVATMAAPITTAVTAVLALIAA